MEDRQYAVIRDAVLARVRAAKVDAQGNLQNLNVLLEGFYREFLNLLFGWKLKNANAERRNYPGVDLLDRAGRIAVQVSGTCDHRKIQHSLDAFREEGDWHFYFLPISLNPYESRDGFTLREKVTFAPETDILTTERLMALVQGADAAVRAALEAFVSLEKCALWEHFDGLLADTRRDHPSFKLMEPDELDRRLFPGCQALKRLDLLGKREAEDAPCPLWALVRETWAAEEIRSVVIEGQGGLGKTVSLLSITDSTRHWCPAPAVYIPMHRLIDEEGKPIALDDYLMRLSVTYGKKLLTLMEQRDAGIQAILLLDGFNEVPGKRRREILRMVNEWLPTKPGAQLIAVSRPMDSVRLSEELAGKPVAYTLEPLDVETAEAYLEERGLPFPAGLDVLCLPLFLTLYVKTVGLEGKKSDGYPLSPKPPKSRGALIWNYLQRQLLIKQTEDWVLPCAVACEYILPYIAYRMAQASRFTLGKNEAKRMIQEAVETLSSPLPRHLAEIFERYDEVHFEEPDLSSYDWTQTVLREAGVIVPGGERGSFAFLHQNFRDALAGLYLVNQAERTGAGELPEIWRHAARPQLMDFAAELMEPETADRLWAANRKLTPTDPAATLTMLELQRRLEKKPLNFSGMDLSALSLYPYLRGENALPILRRPEDSVGTVLSRRSFQAEGHTGRITAVAYCGDGLCVSGSSDSTLRVWNLYTGACLRTLEGHTAWVTAVAYCGDGLCVSGSDDGTLRVWDIRAGACLRTLEGHTESVNAVAYCGDGLCVSGSWDHTLRVWDIHAGTCLRTLEGHTASVTAVAFCGDGLCVSGSSDVTLRLWNIHTGECLDTIEPADADLTHLNLPRATPDPDTANYLRQNGATV